MRDGGSAEQVPISHHVPIPGPWGAQTAAANRCSDSDEPFEARIDAADCQEEQDRQLAMRLQQQEVDEFRRISRMQGARASSQRDKTKLSLGSGPLDAFVKRTKR